MTQRLVRRLRRDESGTTVIEFAVLAPTLMVMLFGLLDLSHNMYTAQMLQGAIQHAARKSTVEGASGSAAALDNAVRRQQGLGLRCSISIDVLKRSPPVEHPFDQRNRPLARDQ